MSQRRTALLAAAVVLVTGVGLPSVASADKLTVAVLSIEGTRNNKLEKLSPAPIPDD